MLPKHGFCHYTIVPSILKENKNTSRLRLAHSWLTVVPCVHAVNDIAILNDRVGDIFLEILRLELGVIRISWLAEPDINFVPTFILHRKIGMSLSVRCHSFGATDYVSEPRRNLVRREDGRHNLVGVESVGGKWDNKERVVVQFHGKVTL